MGCIRSQDLGGTRIEVKSAANVQSWHQDSHSKITFSTRAAHADDADTNKVVPEKKRQADVYVFCLLAHKDKQTVDPLCVDQWQFYVLPTSALDARTRSQYAITLKSLEAMTTQVRYADLGPAVRSATQIRS